MSAPRARPRATLACEMCRSRRTKCDGRKPSCSFCADHDILCKYRDPLTPAPTKYVSQPTILVIESIRSLFFYRNELEIQAIRSRIEDVFNLVYMQSLDRLDPNYVIMGSSKGYSAIGHYHYPMDECLISRSWRMEFPFMTIQTPSTMCLLGLDPKLSAKMVVAERTNPSMMTPPAFSNESNLLYEEAIR